MHVPITRWRKISRTLRICSAIQASTRQESTPCRAGESRRSRSSAWACSGLIWRTKKKPHNVYYAVTGKYISLNLTPIIPAISVYVNLLSERNQRQIVRKRQNQNGKAEICPEFKESKRETGKSAHENRTIEAVYLGGLF